MRKLFLIIMILTISCSGNQVEFKDTPEMTYLEIGPYSLGINKRFELISILESELKKENLDGGTSRISSKEYLFADLKGGQDNIEKGLIVYENRLKDSQQNWNREISYQNTEIDGKIDSGYVRVGSIQMAYMIVNARPSIDPNVMRALNAKGLRIGGSPQKPDHASMIYYAKLIGPSRNIVIIYIDGQANPELAFNESLNYLTLDN